MTSRPDTPASPKNDSPDSSARPTELECVSAAEAADILGLSRSTVSRLIDKGLLPGASVGRRKLVPVAALRALVEETMADFDVAALARGVAASRR